MSVIEVPIGGASWSFNVPAERLATPRSQEPAGPPVADPRAAVRAALENPMRVDFPLRRAMTPGDRIALVIDEELPQLGSLVAGVLEYLSVIGIGPDAVTALTAPGGSSSEWINDLPDEFADLQTEIHQPADRKLLSYLAATKTGRRIYLNRTLVDADQVISLFGRRYDPMLGYAGGEGSLFPALSDTETLRASGEALNMEVPEPDAHALRIEAAEIAWLLGAPIFIQVIEGAGEDVSQVCAGFADSLNDGLRMLDNRWRLSIPERADVVLAGVGTRQGHAGFAALARAAAAASRVVMPDGAVVILSDAEPAISAGMELLRQCEDCSAALKLLANKRPVDYPAAFQWVSVASHARIYLASGLRPETVEEMFATPIVSPHEVQRLLDIGGKVLFLPDADKSLVVVE